MENQNTYRIKENIKGANPHEVPRTVSTIVSIQYLFVGVVIIGSNQKMTYSFNKTNNYFNKVLKLAAIKRKMQRIRPIYC